MTTIVLYVYGPVAQMAPYAGIVLPASDDGPEVTISGALVEPVGTPGRRACFAHAFTPMQVVRILRRLRADGRLSTIMVDDDPPSAWVYA